MPGTLRVHRSRRTKSVRWMVFAIILCSGMSCLAPVLYASTDCSRWLAEYKQGILQRRAERRLQAARYRLVTMVHKPAAPHSHPLRHRMGPLESLRRFQIDCGDLEQPKPSDRPAVPLLPLDPKLTFMSLAETPPDLPPPAQADVTPMPPLNSVPVQLSETLVTPGPVPEPGSFLLVLTGAVATAELVRRRGRAQLKATQPAV